MVFIFDRFLKYPNIKNVTNTHQYLIFIPKQKRHSMSGARFMFVLVQTD